MDYYYFKQVYPNDILVYIESFNREKGIVIFDFIDSNEYSAFARLSNSENEIEKPSMVLLKNYRLRKIMEDTIYSIKGQMIEKWLEQNIIESEAENSFSLGFTITLLENQQDDQIFGQGVAIKKDTLGLGFYTWGSGNKNNLPILLGAGKLSAVVRNVGQGNWNEIKVNDKIKIVFDIGAPIRASKLEIHDIIGDKNIQYSEMKPGLILSHWDMDHYHCLLGMSNKELENFSFFICRDKVPNLTSRKVFNSISDAIGRNNIYTIEAIDKIPKRGPVKLFPISDTTNQLVLYNAEEHKNRNISGLALSLKSKNNSIIFPGDCHYHQISRDILPHINYSHQHNIIVPHHGGTAGEYIYKLPSHVSAGKAVVSVGENNYRHPKAPYLKALKESKFKIIQTQIEQDDIRIDL